MIDVFRPVLTPNFVAAKVHKEARLDVDQPMIDAFTELKRQQQIEGRVPYYDNRRYRILRRPYFREIVDGTTYGLDLAEIKYSYYALLTERSVDPTIKEHVRNRIRTSARAIPSSLKSADENFNTLNEGMLVQPGVNPPAVVVGV